MLLLADTATWIAVGFAVGAAVLALAASLVLLVIVFRRAPDAPPAEEPAPPEPGPAGALEELRAATARSRQLSDIATTIDLDAVLEKTLTAAAATDGVDAAMAIVSHAEEVPLVATVGMTPEEAARQPMSSAPSGEARSVRISYRYDESEEPGPRDGLIRGGVAVPLHEERAGTIGTLAVFWRGDDRVPDDEEIGELEELARSSAPAIRNAQELREARELAELDPLTGVHTRRSFHEMLARETSRAQRYDRGLSLLVFDVESVPEGEDGAGARVGDTALAAVGERLRGVVRQADLPCRLDGERFAVILPEAGARDAERLFGRIVAAIGAGGERVSLSAGVAELRPEDDVVALFQRADDARELDQDVGNGRALPRPDQPEGLPSG